MVTAACGWWAGSAERLQPDVRLINRRIIVGHLGEAGPVLDDDLAFVGTTMRLGVAVEPGASRLDGPAAVGLDGCGLAIGRVWGAAPRPRHKRARDAGSGRCGWGEELQGDAVGVAESEAGAVWRVLDSAVLDTPFVEPARQLLELVAVGAAAGDVVEADLELAEARRGRRALVLVPANRYSITW